MHIANQEAGGGGGGYESKEVGHAYFIFVISLFHFREIATRSKHLRRGFL